MLEYFDWLLKFDHVLKVEMRKEWDDCHKTYELNIYVIVSPMDIYKLNDFWDEIGREFDRYDVSDEMIQKILITVVKNNEILIDGSRKLSYDDARKEIIEWIRERKRYSEIDKNYDGFNVLDIACDTNFPIDQINEIIEDLLIEKQKE